VYIQVCRKLGVVPISFFLRHVDDDRLVLRHHSVDELAAKAIAAPLTVRISLNSMGPTPTRGCACRVIL